MAYIGINNEIKPVKKIYLGVDGKAHAVTGGYIGVDGKARKFWEEAPRAILSKDWYADSPITSSMLGACVYVLQGGSAEEGIDYSWEGGTNVTCYGDWDGTYGNYIGVHHVYIIGNGSGPVKAPENSAMLFRGYQGHYYFYEIDVSNLDTSNVTNMFLMFSGNGWDAKLEKIIGLNNFNTSNVTSMYAMFDTTLLEEIDVSSFNTSKVTNMGQMFGGCPNLTSLDLTNFDTSNVTNMRAMFYGCTNLTSLDLTSFDTSNVTDMAGMFSRCTNLTEIKVSQDKWVVPSGTNLGVSADVFVYV